MSYLSEISLRRGIWLFLIIIAVLIGGTWATIKVTADRLLNQDAEDNARDWAYLLAANVSDLEQIAAGEQPSKRSVAYFEAVRTAGHVFRYVIYNREGYSQLVSDHGGLSFVDISVLSGEAAAAIKTGVPVIGTKSTPTENAPKYFAEAFVPVYAGSKPIAVVAAYVDQTAQRANVYRVILGASLTLCALTGLAFGVPAVA